MIPNRVVVTGMGVIAPNGNGCEAFADALAAGRSGIRHMRELAEKKARCHVAGMPRDVERLAAEAFTEGELLAMSDNMRFCGLAAHEAWAMARMPTPSDEPDPNTGAILGTGLGSLTVVADSVRKWDAGKLRRLGSTRVEQSMGSSISAKLAGTFALGNQVTSNSSACSTGTEAIVMAAHRIRFGQATRMLAGGSEGCSPITFAMFDAMRVLMPHSNDDPERASRPLSAQAGGFVPGAGAGVLLLESLASARERGAPILAEVAGGATNCGGHRGGGSMTAPNSDAVRRCIRLALQDGEVDPREIDLINGHLTGTFADPLEVHSWAAALERGPGSFPWINATKSMIGHGLGAAGGLECVASVLQLHHGFVHPSVNCDPIHPEIEAFQQHVPRSVQHVPLRCVAKASFGFGDVNSCVVFRQWDDA